MDNPEVKNPNTPPRISEQEQRELEGEGTNMMPPPKKSKFSMSGGLMPMIVISVIAAILVSLIMGSLGINTVSKDDFTKNIGLVSTDLAQVKNDVSLKQKEIATSLQNIPASVQQAVNTNMANMTKQISDLKAQVDGYNAKIAEITNTSAAATKQVADLNAKVAETNKLIADYEKRIKALEEVRTTSVSGGTSGSTTSSTYGKLTASLVASSSWNGLPITSFQIMPPTFGNIVSIAVTNGGAGYTSVPAVTFTAGGIYASGASATAYINGGSVTSIAVNTGGTGYVTNPQVNIVGGGATTVATAVASVNPLVASSVTQQFQIQLKNADTSTATNIQMAIGLAVVDNVGNPISSIPSWLTSNITVSSMGLGTSWTYQSTAAPNILIFTNTATSNPFGIGTLTAPVGTTTLTEYITITNNNPSINQSLYLYPMVKVYSYVLQ